MAKDPNKVVLINHESGMAAYGKLSPKTQEEISKDELEALDLLMSRFSWSTIDEMRDEASRLLEGDGYEPVVWPLPQKDIKAIEKGNPPAGLLLMDINPPFKPDSD